MIDDAYEYLLGEGLTDDELYEPPVAMDVTPAPALPPVRIVPPGEDTSTMIIDPLTSIRDVRVPQEFQALAAIVTGERPEVADKIRLVSGCTVERGQITLWEQLDNPGSVEPSSWLVVSSLAGASRLRVQLAHSRERADGLYLDAVVKADQ